MSMPTTTLDTTDALKQRQRILRAAVDETVTAYYEKEEAQIETRKRMSVALAQAKRRRVQLPARRFEDDPSLYDEGQFISTRVARLRTASPQSTIPVYKVLKQWEIPDLKHPLRITEKGTFTRQTPSVVKALAMQEELSFDHPWVQRQYNDILRGLDALRFAIREV